MSGLLGVTVPRVERFRSAGAVIVGTPKTSPQIAALGLTSALAPLGDEGYFIRSSVVEGRAATVIASTGETGAVEEIYEVIPDFGSLNTERRNRLPWPMLPGDGPMIGELVARYRILGLLGTGGMGTVYLAEDTQLGRRVAVKFPTIALVDHDAHARFLREARAASELNHPGIATIFDYGETADGRPFLVMELVRGRSLERIMRAGELSLSTALEIVVEIGAALGEAHRHGVVHRDVKPANVMVDEGGRAKLLDFGLAKHWPVHYPAGAGPETPTFLDTETHSGVVLGTPRYLSPEQARGAAVDGRSDLFALGVVLYEAVTGQPPFHGGGVIEIATNILHVDPVPPSHLNPGVPAQLDDVVSKALAKKPEDRYQSAESLIEDLRRVQQVVGGDVCPPLILRSGGPVSASSAARTSSTLSEILTRPRVRVSSMLIVVALASAAGWTAWQWLRPKPHQPSPEARQWDAIGAAALRDSAYYQASQAFERAIAADDLYLVAHARLAEALVELDSLERAKDELLRATTAGRATLSPIDSLYVDAVAATASRDFSRAIEQYRQIARQTSDAEKPRVLVDLGRAYERNEDVKHAVESYSEAARLDPHYATAFLRLGVLHGRQQQLPDALGAFDKAEALYQALGSVEGRTEVVLQRGALFNKLNKMAAAKASLEQALSLARAGKNTAQEIRTLLQLSSVAGDMGESSRATAYASEAVALADKEGMASLVAQGLVDVCNALFLQGNLREAEKYCAQALASAQKNKAARSEARARFSLASLRIKENDPAGALPYLEHALAFYKQGGYRSETSLSLALLARAHLQKGNYEAALEADEHILQLARAANDQSQVALAHMEIGTVLMHQEKYPQALDQFNQADPIIRALGVQRSIGHNMLTRASVLWQLGRDAEAQSLIAHVSTIAAAPNGGSKGLSASASTEEAQGRLIQGRYAEAQAAAERVLASEGPQFSNAAADAKLVVALAQAYRGRTAPAQRAILEAIDMAKRLNNPRRLARSQLVLAEVMLLAGESPGALAAALDAQASFARSGQHESEWRAWLIAALASQRRGEGAKAHEYARRAADVLHGLEEQWGAENARTYLARPDIQRLRRLLDPLR